MSKKLNIFFESEEEEEEKEDESSEASKCEKNWIWFDSNEESMIDLTRLTSRNFTEIIDGIWIDGISFDSLIRMLTKVRRWIK